MFTPTIPKFYECFRSPNFSLSLNIDEWSEIGTADGFTEYASTKDITVILQIEDDLTVV